jgi:hypothetical protein
MGRLERHEERSAKRRVRRDHQEHEDVRETFA